MNALLARSYDEIRGGVREPQTGTTFKITWAEAYRVLFTLMSLSHFIVRSHFDTAGNAQSLCPVSSDAGIADRFELQVEWERPAPRCGGCNMYPSNDVLRPSECYLSRVQGRLSPRPKSYGLMEMVNCRRIVHIADGIQLP